jgi:transaldolase/glucose-6-phosphate isomerase
MNSITSINELGQSIWLDYMDLFSNDHSEIKKLINKYKISGITSNHTIFENTISKQNRYNPLMKKLYTTKTINIKNIYENLICYQIKKIADILIPIYYKTNKLNGYISLAISPYLANDTIQTINEAKKLWNKIARPNLMIKIAATDEGIEAIEHLVYHGININVTLLFSPKYYKKAAIAFMTGLKNRIRDDKDIKSITSVASCFISRVDHKFNELILKTLTSKNILLKQCLNNVAIANAKIIFQIYKKIYKSHNWKKISIKGGKKQQLLWASTSNKNSKYSKTRYLEELIAPQTINTVNPETLKYFLKYGSVKNTIETNLNKSYKIFQILKQENISFNNESNELLKNGVNIFKLSFNKLLNFIIKQQKIFNNKIL